MIKEIDQVARVFYIDQNMTRQWNDQRSTDQPRLMTGWCWEARAPGGGHGLGLKSKTACYIAAWYALIAQKAQPRVKRFQVIRKVA